MKHPFSKLVSPLQHKALGKRWKPETRCAQEIQKNIPAPPSSGLVLEVQPMVFWYQGNQQNTIPELGGPSPNMLGFYFFLRILLTKVGRGHLGGWRRRRPSC